MSDSTGAINQVNSAFSAGANDVLQAQIEMINKSTAAAVTFTKQKGETEMLAAEAIQKSKAADSMWQVLKQIASNG